MKRKRLIIFNIIGAILLLFIACGTSCFGLLTNLGYIGNYISFGRIELVPFYNAFIKYDGLLIVPLLMFLAIVLIINIKKDKKILYFFPLVGMVLFYLTKIIGTSVTGVFDIISLGKHAIAHSVDSNLFRTIVTVSIETIMVCIAIAINLIFIFAIVMMIFNLLMTRKNKKHIPIVIPFVLIVIHYILFIIFPDSWFIENAFLIIGCGDGGYITPIISCLVPLLMKLTTILTFIPLSFAFFIVNKAVVTKN